MQDNKDNQYSGVIEELNGINGYLQNFDLDSIVAEPVKSVFSMLFGSSNPAKSKKEKLDKLKSELEEKFSALTQQINKLEEDDSEIKQKIVEVVEHKHQEILEKIEGFIQLVTHKNNEIKKINDVNIEEANEKIKEINDVIKEAKIGLNALVEALKTGYVYEVNVISAISQYTGELFFADCKRNIKYVEKELEKYKNLSEENKDAEFPDLIIQAIYSLANSAIVGAESEFSNEVQNLSSFLKTEIIRKLTDKETIEEKPTTVEQCIEICENLSSVSNLADLKTRLQSIQNKEQGSVNFEAAENSSSSDNNDLGDDMTIENLKNEVKGLINLGKEIVDLSKPSDEESQANNETGKAEQAKQRFENLREKINELNKEIQGLTPEQKKIKGFGERVNGLETGINEISQQINAVVDLALTGENKNENTKQINNASAAIEEKQNGINLVLGILEGLVKPKKSPAIIESPPAVSSAATEEDTKQKETASADNAAAGGATYTEPERVTATAAGGATVADIPEEAENPAPEAVNPPAETEEVITHSAEVGSSLPSNNSSGENSLAGDSGSSPDNLAAADDDQAVDPDQTTPMVFFKSNFTLTQLVEEFSRIGKVARENNGSVSQEAIEGKTAELQAFLEKIFLEKVNGFTVDNSDGLQKEDVKAMITHLRSIADDLNDDTENQSLLNANEETKNALREYYGKIEQIVDELKRFDCSPGETILIERDIRNSIKFLNDTREHRVDAGGPGSGGKNLSGPRNIPRAHPSTNNRGLVAPPKSEKIVRYERLVRFSSFVAGVGAIVFIISAAMAGSSTGINFKDWSNPKNIALNTLMFVGIALLVIGVAGAITFGVLSNKENKKGNNSINQGNGGGDINRTNTSNTQEGGEQEPVNNTPLSATDNVSVDDNTGTSLNQ